MRNPILPILFFFLSAACFAEGNDSLVFWKEQSRLLLSASPEAAIGLLNKGLAASVVANDAENEAWFCTQKGMLFLQFSDTAKGAYYLRRALTYYRWVKNEAAMARVEYHFGKAKANASLLQEALAHAEKIGWQEQVFKIRVALASVYAGKKEVEQLNRNLKASLNMVRKDAGIAAKAGGSTVLLARLCMHNGYIVEGRWLIDRSLQDVGLSRSSLGQLCLMRATDSWDRGMRESALLLLDSAYQEFDNLGVRAAIAGKLAYFHTEAGQAQNALRYLELQDSLRTEVRNLDKENLVHLIEGEYANSIKETHIQELQADLERDLYLKGILAATLLIAVVFTFIINRQIRSRRRAKRALLENKKRQEEVAKLLLEAEVEHKKLTEDALLRDIKSNQLDLDHFSETFVQDTEVLKHLQAEIERLKRLTPDAERRKQIGGMRMSLLQITQREFARKRLLNEKVEVDGEWLFRLQERFPKLTEQDMELLVCIYSGMQASDIAELYNIEKQSVMTKRYRLRKKLKLKGTQTFEDFFEEEHAL